MEPERFEQALDCYLKEPASSSLLSTEINPNTGFDFDTQLFEPQTVIHIGDPPRDHHTGRKKDGRRKRPGNSILSHDFGLEDYFPSSSLAEFSTYMEHLDKIHVMESFPSYLSRTSLKILKRSKWWRIALAFGLLPQILAQNPGLIVKGLTYGTGAIAGVAGYAVLRIPDASEASLAEQIL